jgi:starvation-inducible DNA-binding protein
MTYEKNGLAKHLAHLLADVVTLGFLTQGYHWNVKGLNFSQFHEFFAEIYGDVDSAIDPLAENIRKLGYDSPYLLTDFAELTCIVRQERELGDAVSMVESLARVNQSVLMCYEQAFTMASACNEQGIADFVAGRIDMHQKWQWQLKSTLGVQ